MSAQETVAGLARRRDPAEAVMGGLVQDAADGVACESPWHTSGDQASWMMRSLCPRCRAESVWACCDPCLRVLHAQDLAEHPPCKYIGKPSAFVVRMERFRGGP